jgi:hypothetical protein
LLTDVEDAFLHRLWREGTSFYLVRPDGYVGYRASPVRPARLETYLARVRVPATA